MSRQDSNAMNRGQKEGCILLGKHTGLTTPGFADRSNRLLGKVSLIALSLSFSPTAMTAQSLEDAVQGAVTQGCTDLRIPANSEGELNLVVPSALNTFCTSGGGVADSSTGGTITSQIGVSTLGSEKTTEERLEELRDESGMEGDSTSVSFGLLNLFVILDYETHEKDETTIEGGGFESDKQGISVGADYALSQQSAIGLALNYSETDGDFDGSGQGGFDTSSYGLLLYGSLTPAPGWFVDLSVGYANSEHEIERFSTAKMGAAPAEGLLTGDTDADKLSTAIKLGYDLSMNSIDIGPRFTVRYSETDIDGYTETEKSGNPLALVYEDQTERSLTTHLGIQVTKAINWKYGVLVPQGMLEYVHEFQDDQRDIEFSFRDDLGNTMFTFNNDDPDRDYATLMLGLLAVLPNGVQTFINYEGLLAYNDHSNHKISVGVRIEM